MSGKQLCLASSKGMTERSSGSAAASGQRVLLSPRATEGLIQLPVLPGEDPPLCARQPDLPAPEAWRPRLAEHPVPPGSRARAAAGLPSRRCGGGSPPVSTLQLLAASRLPPGPENRPPAVPPVGLLAAAGAGTQALRTPQFPAKTALLPPEGPPSWAGLPGAVSEVAPGLPVATPPAFGGSATIGCRNLVNHWLKSNSLNSNFCNFSFSILQATLLFLLTKLSKVLSAKRRNCNKFTLKIFC